MDAKEGGLLVRTQTGQELVEAELRVRVRLDFKGVSRPGKLFFGGKPTEKVAEETREQQLALFRNVPVQGIRIEDISLGGEIYTVFDEQGNVEVAYAPAELTLVADTVEDLVRFVVRDDFRRIEVLEPANVVLRRLDVERLMFRVNEENKAVQRMLERKYAR
ncbi:MAG: hypothetical protein AB1402_06680 [Bacillota bacterium]